MRRGEDDGGMVLTREVVAVMDGRRQWGVVTMVWRWQRDGEGVGGDEGSAVDPWWCRSVKKLTWPLTETMMTNHLLREVVYQILDPRTMEELWQPTLNGRGGPIAPINIQANTFGLKNDMIQQVQNSCQFHELPGDDANKHLDKFLHVTQSIKVNGVTDDAIRLYLFLYSLTHHATTWFDRLPMNFILSFNQMATKFLSKYFPPSMVTNLRNKITNLRQRPDKWLFEAWKRYKLSIDRCTNHNMLPVTQIDTFYNRLILRHRDTINVAVGGTFMKRRPEECYDLIENMTAHHNDWDTTVPMGESCSSLISSNAEIAALKNEMSKMNKNFLRVFKNQQLNSVTPSYETCGGPHSYHECQAIGGHIQNVYDAGTYNQGGNTYQPQGASQVQNPNLNYQAPAYQAPIHQPQMVTTSDFSNYMKANDVVMKNMQTQMTSLTNSNIELKNMFGSFMKMNIASTSGSGPLPTNTIANPKGELKAITTRSGVSYEGPLILPSFSSLPKEVERVPEVTKDTVQPSTKDIQPSVVQTQVLIDESVVAPKTKTTMPYPSREKLSLPELTPTQMILELVDQSTTRPAGIAEDVFVKVGELHFPTDFIVFDYVVDPRVPLILRRPFLRTEHALIDVYGEELILRVDDEAITFKFGQTSSFSYNDAESINRIDVIDVACEEYAQEVLGFSRISMSGNPTSEPIISTSSLTLTPFGDSDFLLEETDAFLDIEDDSISPKIDDFAIIWKETFVFLRNF
nr:reverse transcriptase domain-containing protein [Tanacetum cinerariifolium]